MAAERRVFVVVDPRKAASGSAEARKHLRSIDTAAERTKKVLASAAVAIGAFFTFQQLKDGIGVISQFETSLASLSAITGASGRDLDFLGKSARRMGLDYNVGASEAAAAIEKMASAKPDLLANAEALAAVSEQAIILAKASGLDLATAAEKLGATMNAFGAPAEAAGQYIDALAAGAKYGAVNIVGLTQGMKEVSGVASAAGLDIYDVVGALELLGEKGLTAEQSGTALKNIIIELSTQATDTNGKITDFAGRLGELAGEITSVEKAEKMFGREAANAALQLANNADRAGELIGKVKELGVANEQAAVKMDTIAEKAAGVRSAWKELVITVSQTFNLGTRLKDSLEGAKLLLEDFSDRIRLLPDAWKLFTTGVELAFLNLQKTIASAMANVVVKMLEFNNKFVASFKGVAVILDHISPNINGFAKSLEDVTLGKEELTLAGAGLYDVLKDLDEQIEANRQAQDSYIDSMAAIEAENQNVVSSTSELVETNHSLSDGVDELNNRTESLYKVMNDVVDPTKELAEESLGLLSAIEKVNSEEEKRIENIKDLVREDWKLVRALQNEIRALQMTDDELEVYRNLSQLSTQATWDQRVAVIGLTLALQAQRDALNQTAAANDYAAQSMQQWKNDIGGIFVNFFDNMRDDGIDAWDAMLDEMTDMLIQRSNSEWQKVLSGQREAGSTGSTGSDVLGGIGAGLQWGEIGGNVGASSSPYGQGSDGSMYTGAATGALGGAAQGFMVGGPTGAIIGAIVGFFAGGLAGGAPSQWETVGQYIAGDISEGVFNGMMGYTQERWAYGSKEFRNVYDELTPQQEDTLNHAFNQFYGSFMDAAGAWDLGDDFAKEVLDSINEGFRVGISGEMTADELIASAIQQFELGVSAPADKIIPGLRALAQEGERVGETFIRVGQAVKAVRSFFDVAGFDVENIIADNFGERVVESLEQIDLTALEGALAGAISNYNDAVARGASQDELQDYQDEITQAEQDLANFADVFSSQTSDIASAIQLGSEAWMASLQDHLGGLEEMNNKFATVLGSFFDTSDLYLNALEDKAGDAASAFTDAIGDIGSLADGVNASNFSQFFTDAMSGAFGDLDPELFAAIVDAGLAWTDLSEAEQQLSLARGEVRDITLLTVDQINALKEVGLDWNKTLSLMGHESSMARGELAEFVLGVADLVGGLEAANQKFYSFIDTFFTESEKFDYIAGSVAAGIEQFGLTLEDVDTKAEIAALMLKARNEGNSELFAWLMNNQGLLVDFIGGLEGLDSSADGATGAIDDTSRALQENVQYWGQIGSAIRSALADVQSSIASLQNQAMASLGANSTAPGSFNDAINLGFGAFGSGSIEEQIGNLENLHDLVMQQYNAQVASLNSQASAAGGAADAAADMGAEQTEAARRAHDAAMDYWQRMQAVARSLKDYIRELEQGPLSNLTGEQKLEVAQVEFQRLLELALNGDVDAAEQIQGAAGSLLDVARSMYGSTEQFDIIFNSVLSGLKAVAELASGVNEPPPWVEPVTSAITGSVSSASGANTAAIAQLREAAVEKLKLIEEELKRLQGLQEAEEQAAIDRLASYQDNTENYLRIIAESTGLLAREVGQNPFPTREIPEPADTELVLGDDGEVRGAVVGASERIALDIESGTREIVSNTRVTGDRVGDLLGVVETSAYEPVVAAIGEGNTHLENVSTWTQTHDQNIVAHLESLKAEIQAAKNENAALLQQIAQNTGQAQGKNGSDDIVAAVNSLEQSNQSGFSEMASALRESGEE